jgi:hypothetical protein
VESSSSACLQHLGFQNVDADASVLHVEDDELGPALPAIWQNPGVKNSAAMMPYTASPCLSFWRMLQWGMSSFRRRRYAQRGCRRGQGAPGGVVDRQPLLHAFAVDALRDLAGKQHFAVRSERR